MSLNDLEMYAFPESMQSFADDDVTGAERMVGQIIQDDEFLTESAEDEKSEELYKLLTEILECRPALRNADKLQKQKQVTKKRKKSTKPSRRRQNTKNVV